MPQMYPVHAVINIQYVQTVSEVFEKDDTESFSPAS